MSEERYDDQLEEQEGSQDDPPALFAGTKKAAVNAPVAPPASASGSGPQSQPEQSLLDVQDNLGISDEEFSESEAYTSGTQEVIRTPEPESSSETSQDEDDDLSLFHSFLQEAQTPEPDEQDHLTYGQDNQVEYSVPAEGEQVYSEGDYGQPAEEGTIGDYAPEGEYSQGEHFEQDYAEGEYPQPAEYAQGEYAERAYADGEYEQQEYTAGENQTEADGEYAEGTYTVEAHAEGQYGDREYSEQAYNGAEYGQEADAEIPEQTESSQLSEEQGHAREPDYTRPVAPTSGVERETKQFEPGESGEFAAFVLEESARLRRLEDESTEIEPVDTSRPVESAAEASAQAVSGLQQTLSGAHQAQQALSGAQRAVPVPQSDETAPQGNNQNIPLVQLSGVYPELTAEQLASPIEVASIVGETLCDEYRVLGEHGEGDLTQVYIGREIDSGRLVAIKRLKVPTPKAVERFSLAIKNLGKLNHPGIVQSIAYLESPSGEPFYVMECVEDGISLEELLHDTGMIEEEDVIASILIQIADAVDFAHKASVVHGGLKPSNIMLLQGDEDLIVKILDFGMERLRVANRALASSYFAPEQVTQGVVSSKSDIYSLGVLAYHMLTGHLPYDGSVDSIAQLQQGQKPEEWQPLYAVRPELACVQELSQLLDEAMEVDPQWRMNSMAEFKQGLVNWFESVQELDYEDEDSGSDEQYAVSSEAQLPATSAAPAAPNAPVTPTFGDGGDPSGGRDWSTATLEIPIEEDPLEMFGQNRLSEPDSMSASEAIARLNQEDRSFHADTLADDEFQTADMADEEQRMRIDQPPGAPNLDQVFSKEIHDSPYTVTDNDSASQRSAVPPGVPMPPPPPPRQRPPEAEKSVTQRQLEHLQNMIEAEAVEAGEAAPTKKKKRKRISKRRVGQNVRSTITKLVALKHTEYSQGQTMTVQFTEKFAGKGTRLSPQQTIFRLVATAVISLTLIVLCVMNLETLKGLWVTTSHTMSNLLLKKKLSEEEIAMQEQERKELERAAKAQAERPLVPTAKRPEVPNSPGQFSQQHKKGEYNSLSKGPIADKDKMTPQKGWEKRSYRKGEIVYPYYNFEEQPIVQQGNNLTGQRLMRKGDSEMKEITPQTQTGK